MAEEKEKKTESHVDRLMADIRGKVAFIASEADRSTEACVAFYRKEAEFAEWRNRHQTSGIILHRDTAASRTSHLHVAACPVVGGGEGMEDDETVYTQMPKVGCPTKEAALAYARAKKWKVNESCEKCPE